MKKTVVFIITHLQNQNLPNFTLKEMRKFPAPYEKMYKAKQTTYILHYKLSKNMIEEDFINHYIIKLKKELNAYSVQVGSMPKQLKK